MNLYKQITFDKNRKQMNDFLDNAIDNNLIRSLNDESERYAVGIIPYQEDGSVKMYRVLVVVSYMGLNYNVSDITIGKVKPLLINNSVSLSTLYNTLMWHPQNESDIWMISANFSKRSLVNVNCREVSRYTVDASTIITF